MSGGTGFRSGDGSTRSAERRVGVMLLYPANGQQFVYCWTGFIPGATYYFRYTKTNDGYSISGAGNVQKQL